MSGKFIKDARKHVVMQVAATGGRGHYIQQGDGKYVRSFLQKN